VKKSGTGNKSRSILIFEQYVQSSKTREQYLYHLTKFAEHYHLKSIDSILFFDINDLKEKIEDYVYYSRMRVKV